MIKSFSSDKINLMKGSNRALRLAKAKQSKIDRLAHKFENVPLDEVERWVNDDFDGMESRIAESRNFFKSIEECGNIPIKSTGKAWYHSEQRIGRVFKSIHEGNIKDNRTTMLIFRPNDSTIYRLSIRAGKEFQILSTAISKGYILSEMIVNYGDIK